MEAISQVNRRKACDLCFIKKLRCDMVKPICSHCRQYEVDCKTTAVRRRTANRSNSRRPMPQPAAPELTSSSVANGADPSRIDGLESRLARMEEQLQQVLSAVSSVAVTTAGHGQEIITHYSSGQTGNNCPKTVDLDEWFEMEDEDRPVAEELDDHALECDPIDYIVRPPPPKLGPLHEILPIVDTYFTHFNSQIPLFSQPDFMRMLYEWYSAPSRRSRAVWAAVNVVLALGSRVPSEPVWEIDFSAQDPKFTGYMKNVQSAVAELMTRDKDLLGLQVLLGLVILYNESKDPRPATLLIGAAVRLIHRLRFQSKDDIEALYTPEEGLHRTRLFWITYMLDKGISLKHQTPSLQLDADIDLDLPSSSLEDGAGDIYTADGRVRVNYFRLSVQLAYIRGRTYDLLYSTRSTKVSPQERQSRVVRLSRQLEKWRLSIPAEMQIGSVADHVGRMELVSMATLHCSYLSCMFMVHGIWSSNADWIKRISSYSRTAIKDSEVEGRRCFHVQHPPLPAAWTKCVQGSRDCLMMAKKIPQSDCTVWLSSCAIVSALIVVLANMYEFPENGCVESDKELCSFALAFFNKFKGQSTLVPFERLQVVIMELDQHARLAEERVAMNKRLASTEAVRADVKLAGQIPLSNNEVPLEALPHDVMRWNTNSENGVFGEELGLGGLDMSVYQRRTGDNSDLFGHDAGPLQDWLDLETNFIFGDGAA
ncbi:fungal-specific transcription factor domain-containing protein [Apodospora peruviana]|uniref:Fungal-specific transcription factor domain-containing protein n=1 Tax=Apodospora peruviana TaxID=516989 RepID=A0AAE0I242_9PEZI|nr:fungal-specific transcription factor domain-containing protein [Apodospora peruviana]